jgi:hypothetical protein
MQRKLVEYGAPQAPQEVLKTENELKFSHKIGDRMVWLFKDDFPSEAAFSEWTEYIEESSEDVKRKTETTDVHLEIIFEKWKRAVAFLQNLPEHSEENQEILEHIWDSLATWNWELRSFLKLIQQTDVYHARSVSHLFQNLVTYLYQQISVDHPLFQYLETYAQALEEKVKDTQEIPHFPFQGGTAKDILRDYPVLLFLATINRQEFRYIVYFGMNYKFDEPMRTFEQWLFSNSSRRQNV